MYTRILRASVLLLGLTTMPAGSLAHAQDFGHDPNQDVRLDWAVAQGRKGQEIAGYVYNRRDGYWAANVRLQVEALDASGNLIGSNLGFVFGDIPPRTARTSRSGYQAAGRRLTGSRSGHSTGGAMALAAVCDASALQRAASR